MKALFDTNILIDYLNGEKQAKLELSKYKNKLISIVTRIEILVGLQQNTEEENLVKNFLQEFQLVHLNNQISEICIEIKRTKKIRLPDAIIWATAIKEDALLVTRNTKDFPADEPSIRMPYKI